MKTSSEDEDERRLQDVFIKTNVCWVNFITQLFHSDGSIKNWNILKTEYALQDKDHFCRLQLINAILEMWKKFIKQTSENTRWLVVKDHHLLWGFQDYHTRKPKF